MPGTVGGVQILRENDLSVDPDFKSCMIVWIGGRFKRRLRDAENERRLRGHVQLKCHLRRWMLPDHDALALIVAHRSDTLRSIDARRIQTHHKVMPAGEMD